MSPSAASSPVVSTFPDAAKVGRSSPAPPANVVARPPPPPSRARQNSTHSNVENGKPRPSSSASNKPNGVPAVPTPDPAPQTNGLRPPSEKAKDPPPPLKPEPVPVADEPPVANIAAAVASITKEGPVKVDETEAKKETTPSLAVVPTPPTVTTKSGRASKPSTPALASFPDMPRSRPSRAGEGATVKRSHKKGASTATAQTLTSQSGGLDFINSAGDKQDDEDEDPLYCYCNGVSYGEMIACDGLECAKEWFHLECVGLKVAPKGNGKFAFLCPRDDRLPIADTRVNSEMVLRRLQTTAEGGREEAQREMTRLAGMALSVLASFLYEISSLSVI